MHTLSHTSCRSTAELQGSPCSANAFVQWFFYSSPMIHPSQLQQPQPPSSATAIAASPSTWKCIQWFLFIQKHLQSQQQRPQSSGVTSGSGSANLQNFPTQKTQPPQQLQQSHNQYVQSARPRHLEGEPW
ncbi:UNVERIFIED_CONTAM: hypothetical protein Sradi_1656800 [Sesamum radiatum]|uniref:Uncharacterized protein n=1 Tax=Sesamum radiatum TaxID=300843 RepID=A0AAW2UG91_SESRA